MPPQMEHTTPTKHINVLAYQNTRQFDITLHNSLYHPHNDIRRHTGATPFRI